MSIKHTVSCGRCGAEAEANKGEGVRWDPPYGWLSVTYNLVKDGTYTVFENRHACPDCAQGMLEALGKATSPVDK